MATRRDYYIVTRETGERPHPWCWELRRHSSPMGVRVGDCGYQSQMAAEYAVSERLWRSWMPSKKRRGDDEAASMSAGKSGAPIGAAQCVCNKWTAAQSLKSAAVFWRPPALRHRLAGSASIARGPRVAALWCRRAEKRIGAATSRPLLIVHFEETGIRGDVFCPQLLHHRLHFMGPIVFAIWEHISRLAWIHFSCARRTWVRSIRSPGWQVDNTLGRNLKLVSSNRRGHSAARAQFTHRRRSATTVG